MEKAIIALSGGLDSSTLLGDLLHSNKEVHCCVFIYPSKHNTYEVKAAQQIVEHYQKLNYPVHIHTFDLSNVFSMFTSNLLKQGDAIPEGHYQSDTMKLTVVPGRNAIFTTIMAGFAESIKAEYVYLGVHAGDHAIYPDCRPDFINSIGHTISLSSGESVYVSTPYIHMTKKEILMQGVELGIPYELTRTCYKDQDIACGKCGSCNERLEAFKLLNLKDPIAYE